MSAGTASGPLSGRLLARHAFYNLGGLAVPVLLGLATLPLLVRGLGVPRFGFLALAWAAVGYFNLFGFGLDRALAHGIASREAAGRDGEIPSLVWTVVAASLTLGAVAGVLLHLAAPVLAGSVLRVPADLQGEARAAFRTLALALPFAVGAAPLIGVLQARRRFGLLNLIAAPGSAWTYLAPLAVLPFTRALPVIVAVLVAGRIVLWAAYLTVCLRVVPALRTRPRVRPAVLVPLLRFGGWLSVSNVVSPILVHVDRFFVGAFVSVSAVAYYATPQEIVTRLASVAGAVAAVLFPSVAGARDDAGDVARIMGHGLKLILLLLVPVALVLAALAPEILGLWLGPPFAEHGARVLRLLAAGLVVNGLAMVPYTALQAGGRPDLTARVHLVELPFYLAALAYLASNYGLAGAAAAWFSRVTVDAAALAWLAARRYPPAVPQLTRGAGAAALVLALLAASAAPEALAVRAPVAVVAGAVIAGVVWMLVLSESDRVAAMGWLRGRRVS